MISTTELIGSINEATQRGIPFLFGVDFELSNAFFIPEPLQQTEVLWRTPKYSNFTKSLAPKKSFHYSPLSFDAYLRKFDLVQKGLQNGDTFLLNLTVKTPLETAYSLREIALASNSPYLLYIPDKFVCFSPETFVRIDRDGGISTNPMKGTIRCDVDKAEECILNDYKESCEHFTIVDLMRSDLARIATNIQVNRLRYVDRLETSKGAILQVSSQISGTLLEEYKDRLGECLFQLLPAGSVSGAPKKSTLNLIRQAEREKRGFYCGIFGYFDGQEMDTAVLIRYIESLGNTCFFRSGAGITIHSDPRSEYEENNNKIYLPFESST